MSDTAKLGDAQPVLDLIASIEADLARLKAMVQPPLEKFDPSNPHNKTPEGKLTSDGVECCYRMFDEGKSRYSVARAMKISFAAATHRFKSWREAGATIVHGLAHLVAGGQLRARGVPSSATRDIARSVTSMLHEGIAVAVAGPVNRQARANSDKRRQRSSQ